MDSSGTTQGPGSRAQSPGEKTLEGVIDELSRQGILMLSDAKLPSVVSLVVGAPVKGSWWGHPKGHLIYSISQDLSDHSDVLETKLLSGKVTFVHRRLWPALLAACRGREPWQLQGLPGEALRLLEIVEEKGQMGLDILPANQLNHAGEAARELERRLLVRGTEVHTKAGAHSKILETWDHWARKVGSVETPKAPARGREELETIVLNLNRRFGANAKLPWQ